VASQVAPCRERRVIRTGCRRATIVAMVTVDDVRRIATSLPRTEEALVRDRVKFRIGRIVYLSLSADETVLGFAFPKEERAALVAAEPDGRPVVVVTSDQQVVTDVQRAGAWTVPSAVLLARLG